MLCIFILINTILNVLKVECLVNALLGTTRLAGTRYMINYRQKKRIVTYLQFVLILLYMKEIRLMSF